MIAWIHFIVISSYISDNIHNTNKYFYNSVYTISNINFKYINRDTLNNTWVDYVKDTVLTNRLLPYTLNSDTITMKNNLFMKWNCK